MSNLDKNHCEPCKSGAEPLSGEQIDIYLGEIDEAWEVEESKRLVREIEMNDFLDVIDVVNQIAELAEAEGHHPNLTIHSYNQLKIELFTHKIGGLHENDFILARKIDKLL